MLETQKGVEKVTTIFRTKPKYFKILKQTKQRQYNYRPQSWKYCLRSKINN